MMDEFAELVPQELLQCSGKVFYSGRTAFSGERDLYVLGLNPGGDPHKMNESTIADELDKALNKTPMEYSCYVDESWDGREPGTARMQPRVSHLLNHLVREPRSTPSSNLIFLRSSREADLKRDKTHLIEQCWPFHARVIDGLGVKMVIAFGKTVGREVRKKLNVHQHIDSYVETNKRRWRSEIHIGEGGRKVATLTHPSIADWTQPETDPSALVRRALDEEKQ